MEIRREQDVRRREALRLRVDRTDSRCPSGVERRIRVRRGDRSSATPGGSLKATRNSLALPDKAGIVVQEATSVPFVSVRTRTFPKPEIAGAPVYLSSNTVMVTVSPTV